MKKLSFLFAALVVGVSFGDVVVDDELPAGNIEFSKIEGTTVCVNPDLRDTQGDWFYWAMRVRGAAGQTLTFSYTKDCVGVRGPVVTRDKGQTFSYPLNGNPSVTRRKFTYTFAADEDETWFYECIPYLPKDWDAFIAAQEAKKGTYFTTGVLCQSTWKGADVPMAQFGCLTGTPKYRIILSSRHHCSESVATFVVEGFAAAFLKDDDLGVWLRENVFLSVVPFVDYDGVVAGDQGKNRVPQGRTDPRDHNRDYMTDMSASTYTETRALAALVEAQNPDAWFDIHCPALSGGCNETLYSPGKDGSLRNNDLEREARFSELLESLQCGTMAYRASDDIPFGEGWNTGSNYTAGKSCIIWALSNENLTNLKVCRTFEVPFAKANGTTVTGETCRDLGADIAKTAKAFLLELEGQPTPGGGGDEPAKDLDKLPDEYTRLEYVQSTHEQYVDTGYKPNAKTKIVASFSVVEYNEGSGYKGAYLFGCYGGNNAGRCQFRYGQPLFVGWGSSYDNSSYKQYPLDAAMHTLVLDRGSFSIDGGSPVYSKSWSGTSVSLGLFGSNPNDGELNPSLFSAIKLYSLVISEGGDEKLHCIPAIDGNGGVGLYDTVGNTFYRSDPKTKALVAGPTVGPVSDAPRFAGFSAGGDEKGVWGEVSVKGGKDYGATVEAYIGADPASWMRQGSWTHAAALATYAATNTEVALGSSYCCAFRMTYEKDGETVVKWTSTNTVGVTGSVHWSGAAGDGRWTNAGNWKEGLVPTSLTSDYFSQSGTTVVKAGDEALYGRGVYVTQGTVIWDFTSGTALTNTWLHLGEEGRTSATLIVSNGVINTTAVSSGNKGAPTFDSSNSTFELVGTRAKFGGFDSWKDHCVFHLLDGAYVEVDSISIKNTGWSSQILIDQGSCLRVTGKDSGNLAVDGGSKVIVDGGAVTNWGSVQLSMSTDSSGSLFIRNGGVFAQRCTSDKCFSVGARGKGRVYVTDGGLLTADMGIWLGRGSDGSGAESFVNLTNGTVRTAGLHVGYDTRYDADYFVRVIGENALLDASSITLGAEAFSAGKNREAGSAQLEVDGGTVQVKNAINVGTVYERVPDVLTVKGGTAKVRAASIACTTNAVFKFVIPKRGFDSVAVETTGTIALNASTPIEIDASECRTAEWQTLLAGEEITNLSLDQVSVSVAEGRKGDLRLVKNDGEKVTALQFRLKGAGLMLLFK